MNINSFPVNRVIVPLLVLIATLAACASPLTVAPPPEAQPAPEAVPPVQATTTSPPTTPPPPAPKGPVFQTSNLIITPAEVSAGSRVTIQVTVANTGDEPGSTNVTLMIDGAATDKETVNLAPGARREVSFARYQSTNKVYSVNVDNLSGTFTVKWTPPPATSAPTTTTPAAPATKDVAWSELRTFLLSDNATSPLKTSATAAGIRAGKASLKFSTGIASMDAFNTTDYGLIYVGRKVEGGYLIWSIDVPSYFCRALPITQLDIRFLRDQAWWAKLSGAYGAQITSPTGERIWDSPTEVNVTW